MSNCFLVLKTQNSDEPFPTTSEDLAGFWDMVNIQVDHINTLFGELHTLQSNGWVEVVAASTLSSSSSNNKAVKKSNRSTSNAKASVASTPRSAKAEEAAKAREGARRKMMEDRKRMMKAKKAEGWGNYLYTSLLNIVPSFKMFSPNSDNRKARD
jgi:discs, large-associated protein 1